MPSEDGNDRNSSRLVCNLSRARNMKSPVGTVGARGGTKCVDVALDKAIDVDEVAAHDGI